jgi:hypothetical protein
MTGYVRRILLTIVSTLSVGLWVSAAQAHGGVSMEKDRCVLKIGPHVMHFSGYQPDRQAEKEFCEDIPETGKTIIVLDEVTLGLSPNEGMRDLPIEVRIVRDGVGDLDLDKRTVFLKPAKVYPSGSLTFNYTFDEPGNFIGIVTMGDRTQYVSRFPFSVGGHTFFHKYKGTIWIIFAALLGSAALLWFSISRSGRDESDHSKATSAS